MQYIIDRQNARPIKFSGEKIASTDSRQGSNGRWTELALYKTDSGKYVCEKIGLTLWQGGEGGRNTDEAVVCESITEVVEYFGLGWLAKEIYQKVNIDIAEEI